MATQTQQQECKHCHRQIVEIEGQWIDPNATGDDTIWQEVCDTNKMFSAEHEPQPQDIWVFLEDETQHHPTEVKALFEWSLNYDHDQRPFNAFLDLIGYSEDNYGVAMGSNVRLGYLEADYLGDALKEWANYPQQVEDWITKLMECEG